MTKKLKFMDFCAGIGAGRLGLENAGLSCVAFSEIDKNAEITYRQFFGNNEENYGDLTKISPSELPDFDLMIAGFPCQTFSVVGQRKGFDDARGRIIYSLIKILKEKNIPYFVLENVKGLINHNKGQTLKTILKDLDDVGYNVSYEVLNSIDYGVPQMRERIYFIGVRKDLPQGKFKFKCPISSKTVDITRFLSSSNKNILDEKKQTYKTFLKYLNNKYNKGRFSIEDLLKQDCLVLDTRQSDLRLYKNKIPTLRTGRHGILYVKDNKFKKLSGGEALMLQGIPENLVRRLDGKLEEGTILKQAGNAMTVNVIEQISKQLLEHVS
ncbi:MAG: DNA (cytosine-5-)-methyltransferase [Candidatus Gastranaerophilaceae bacterium]